MDLFVFFNCFYTQQGLKSINSFTNSFIFQFDFGFIVKLKVAYFRLLNSPVTIKSLASEVIF